jgi:hypothetical protein
MLERGLGFENHNKIAVVLSSPLYFLPPHVVVSSLFTSPHFYDAKILVLEIRHPGFVGCLSSTSVICCHGVPRVKYPQGS